MNKYLKSIILLLTIWVVAGCASDPKRQADAAAVQLQADQDAADQAQARWMRLVEFERDQAMQDARAERWIEVQTWMIYGFGAAGTFALVMILIGAGVGGGIAAFGTGTAISRGAMVRANLIGLDNETRQYPLLLEYLGKGKYTLTNPNTNAVTLLDTSKDADRLMISTSGATQYAGALAEAASRRNADANGIAQITAPVITLKAEDVNYE